MKEPYAIQCVVQLVKNGLLQNIPAAEVVTQLVAAGVPADKAPELYSAVKKAMQAGALADFMKRGSAPDGQPEDPLLAAAFLEGQNAFHPSVFWAWLWFALRVGVFLLVLFVLGKSLGWWGQ